MTAASHPQQLRAIARAGLESIEDQVLVSQSRCIDLLLDIFTAADDAIVRDLIIDCLRSIRFQSSVATTQLRRDLEMILARSSERAALDLEWAEEALTCQCDACAVALSGAT